MNQHDRYLEFNNKIIPVVKEENGEFWFVGNVIAEVLGYKMPRQQMSKVLERNPEDFQGYVMSTQIDYEGQKREVTLLNEEGVYTFCMLAKTILATKFRRAVAEMIKSWREQELPKGPHTAKPTNSLDIMEQQVQLLSGMVTQLREQEQAIKELAQDVHDIRTGLVDINQPLREQFNETIRRTAIKAQMEYRDVYNYVYTKIKEDKNIDVKRRAKNKTARNHAAGVKKEVKPIEIIEDLGMLGYAVQLAKVVEKDLDPRSEIWRGSDSKQMELLP